VFACTEDGCKRFYTTPYNLQQHITSFHKKEMPYLCSHNDCKDRFTTKQSMLRHFYSLHTGVRKQPKLKGKKKRTLTSKISGHIAVREE
jgi:hypothetical protein